jgi:hypothetical protein
VQTRLFLCKTELLCKAVTMNGKRARAQCIKIEFYYNLLRFELSSNVPFVIAG